MKPMPTGCIKNDSNISWRTFSLLLERVDLDDPIGHLFIVDFKFDHENATKIQIMYKEVYLLIIEKQKIIDVHEKSTYQLLDQYKENNDGVARGYRATSIKDINHYI